MPKATHTHTTHNIQNAARPPTGSTDGTAAGGPPLSLPSLGLALVSAEAQRSELPLPDSALPALAIEPARDHGEVGQAGGRFVPTRRALVLAGLGVAAMTAPPIGTELGAHPDAELIALCAQHVTNLRRYNNPERPHLEPDVDPLWHAYEATHDAISSAKPKTLAGMRAKAEAAIADAGEDYTPEDSASHTAELWAWHLLNDLLRMT